MKAILLILLVALVGGFWYFKSNLAMQDITDPITNTVSNLQNNNQETPSQTSNTEKVSVVADDLDTPWAIAFLPPYKGKMNDPVSAGSALFTERSGRVRYMDSSGNLQVDVLRMPSKPKEIGEGGLLGIAAHPNFASNKYIYMYYTYSGSDNNTLNRVVRLTMYDEVILDDEKVVVDAIPGASNHNGGRIKFGPDGYLYIGTGDAQEPSKAQDTNSMAGKILRVTENGDPAPGNPFGNRVYSYGHRNVQGLAWDKDGNLWATEHGPSGAGSCCDELNKIESGKNYGWPDIQGDKTKSGMQVAVKNSGSGTWAPSGVAYLNGSFYFSGLRGQTLYEAIANGSSVTQFNEHFKNEYGRLREVILGPDNMLYVTTSNKDGRGSPKSGDDKILRINPNAL